MAKPGRLPVLKNYNEDRQRKKTCGVARTYSNGHSWAGCFASPVNAQKKAGYHDNLRRNGTRNKYKANSAEVIFLEARLATAKAPNNMYRNKIETPSAASTMDRIDNVVTSTSDNDAEKEAELLELAQSLIFMYTVNGSGSLSIAITLQPYLQLTIKVHQS